MRQLLLPPSSVSTQLEFWKKNVCNLNSSVMQMLISDHLVSYNQLVAQLDVLLFIAIDDMRVLNKNLYF